jgi:hypothetical protein
MPPDDIPREEEEVVEKPDTADVDPDSPEGVFGAEVFDDDEPTGEPELGDEEPPTSADTDDVDDPGTIDNQETPDAVGDAATASTQPESDLVDHTIKWGGSEFVVKVTKEQAKVLNAQSNTALQFPHLQQKYNEVNARLERAAELAQRPAPTAPGGSAEFDPEAFNRSMEPVVRDAVERGALSEYFAETFPDVAAHMAYGHLKLEALERQLAPINQEREQAKVNDLRARLKSEIHAEMSKLAAEDPNVFGDLNVQEKRDQFFDHLVRYNVDVQLLASQPKEVLSAMYAAWQGPSALAAAKAAATQAAAASDEKRRMATTTSGGGGAHRGAPAPSGIEDILDTFKT